MYVLCVSSTKFSRSHDNRKNKRMGFGSRETDDTVGDDSIDELPEACLVNTLAFVTPRDACRVSTLSSMFKSAAESDALWEKFLPPNYKSIIHTSSDPSLLVRCSSKKDLYLHLSSNPILVDGGLKSFSLEKFSGKIQYMLSAKDLNIVWSDTPMYWTWVDDPQATFSEVAELLSVCWLEIRGKVKTSLLSKGTLYAAYLVFQFTFRPYGFENCPIEVSVGLVGCEPSKKKVCLCTGDHRGRLPQPRRRRRIFPRGVEYDYGSPPPPRCGGVESSCCMKKREDGWYEVELGEFLNCDQTGSEELEMTFLEVERGGWKGGLRVHGIEIRPKLV